MLMFLWRASSSSCMNRRGCASNLPARGENICARARTVCSAWVTQTTRRPPSGSIRRERRAAAREMDLIDGGKATRARRALARDIELHQ